MSGPTMRICLVAVLTLATLTFGLGLCACGPYSASSGRVDESIRKVAVPFLDNRTAEPNIEVLFTQAIIRALQIDNTLKVVSEHEADTLLTGSVTRYRLREAFTNADLQVNEYQVQIAVRLTFASKSSGEEIFANRAFSGTGNYILNDPATNEDTARADAAGEIVRGVLALVVQEW